MRTEEFKELVLSLFDREKVEKFPKEYGFTINNETVKKVGYCTNLTPAAVAEAARNEVDFLLTHHDAWSFIWGMKEKCLEELARNGISHCFFHLLLDDCEFGTNMSFMERLGVQIVEKTSIEDEMLYCGRIGELPEPMEFGEFVKRIETILEETVKAWKNHGRPVKRIGFISGGGFGTSDMKEFYEKNCDVYITGEKLLYTVEYAEFVGMDLIVGSHTFTEIFGVESLAKKVQEADRSIELVKIEERHIE